MLGDRRGCSLRLDNGRQWALELRPLDGRHAGQRVRILAERIGPELLSIVELWPLNPPEDAQS